MADQTVQEKLEELHRMQIEMLQRQIKEQHEQFQFALEREREERQEQREAAVQLFQDRTQELTKQNDGMLGAIGRLHGENEVLRKKLQDAENMAKDRQEMIQRNEHQLQIEMERMRLEIHERERKTKEELAKVQEENLALRRRLGEKIPKAKGFDFDFESVLGAMGKAVKGQKKKK